MMSNTANANSMWIVSSLNVATETKKLDFKF